jgi:hypothetical protein
VKQRVFRCPNTVTAGRPHTAAGPAPAWSNESKLHANDVKTVGMGERTEKGRMRNSKKFKFLGEFFSAKNLDRIDQLAGRIPARGLTVGHPRNQRGFPRQPAVGLPLAENARQRAVGRS